MQVMKSIHSLQKVQLHFKRYKVDTCRLWKEDYLWCLLRKVYFSVNLLGWLVRDQLASCSMCMWTALGRWSGDVLTGRSISIYLRGCLFPPELLCFCMTSIWCWVSVVVSVSICPCYHVVYERKTWCKILAFVAFAISWRVMLSVQMWMYVKRSLI